MDKKSQIQSMETIAIVFVFFIFVFIGIMFYMNVARSNISERIDEYKELSKIQVVQVVSSLPELQCSQDNIVEPNCLDWMKVEEATDIVTDADYFDLFGFSRITIKQVFPYTYEYVFYDRLKEDEDKLASYFPISLFDAKTQDYSFGVLVVEVNE